jgi:thiosulfate reductase cytochrome b subunit
LARDRVRLGGRGVWREQFLFLLWLCYHIWVTKSGDQKVLGHVRKRIQGRTQKRLKQEQSF